MLQPRHRRSRSTQQAPSTTASVDTVQKHSIARHEIGPVEWSKTASRACSRLVPSLQQIFNRGEAFTGAAGDSYGLLLSSDSAFIFPYTTTSTTPPILTFPLPQGEDKLLGALIPGPSNEPGLLVVMPTSGRIGYWPALHSALAPSSGLESILSLGGGEYVTQLCNAGAAGLVLATSSGRMVHISLRDGAGKAIVQLTNMSAGGGWLGALKSVATRKEIVAVSAGAAQSREERQVHSITKYGGLTIWEISRGGNYRTILDIDLWPILSEARVVEVLDVVAYPAEANSIILLAKTKDQQTTVLVAQFDTEARPDITRKFELPILESPKIHLPNPGQVAFVHTKRTVHMITLATGSIDPIKLHQHVEIVATGVEDQLKNKRNSGLILLTNGAGVLRIEAFAKSPERPDRIKSRLEQAVFYGSRDANPISFTPPPTNADLAARELSAEILSGTCLFLPKSVNLRDMLEQRILAMQNLINYIRDEIKPITAQLLREHSEKVVAGEALWNSVDARVESSNVMSQIVPQTGGHAEHKGPDPVRTFFLHGLDKIAQVVTNAHRACVEAAAVLDSQSLSRVVTEMNEVMLSILISATRYRDEHSEYGKEGEQWTSQISVIQALVIQFSICQRLVGGLKQGQGRDLQDQIVGLAGLNCRLFEDYFAATPESSKERESMQQKYKSSRPQWLKFLVEIGRTESALEIGERFKDYQTLIEICHDQGETANDEDVINTVVRRVEWYLHTFGYDFATVLWEYYISHRQFWNLLHQFPSYRQYLTKFFEDGRYPNVSWMNDVVLGNYDRAAKTLLAVQETRIEKRKVQLSIAKLSFLVDQDTVPDHVERQIQYSLILDSMLIELRETANNALDTTAAIELCCNRFIPPVSPRNVDRPGLLRGHITKLWNGEILSPGEAIDYLTTRNEPNFFEALRVWAHSELPEAVSAFLEHLIWRRCFIADDWSRLAVDTTAKSDASVERATVQTHLFRSVDASVAYDLAPPIRFPGPGQVYFVERQVMPWPAVAAKEVTLLRKEYGLENELLDRYEAGADLPSWHAGIVRTVREGTTAVTATSTTTMATATTTATATMESDDDFVRVEHGGGSGGGDGAGTDDDVFMDEE